MTYSYVEALLPDRLSFNDSCIRLRVSNPPSEKLCNFLYNFIVFGFYSDQNHW